MRTPPLAQKPPCIHPYKLKPHRTYAHTHTHTHTPINTSDLERHIHMPMYIIYIGPTYYGRLAQNILTWDVPITRFIAHESNVLLALKYLPSLKDQEFFMLMLAYGIRT